MYVGKEFNLSDEATYGMPINPDWDSCGPCHDINPTEQLWGVCSSDIDLSALLNGTDSHFSALNAKYDYTLWQTGRFSALFDPTIPRVDIAVVGNPVTAGVTVNFPVIAGNTWYIDVQLKEGWQPSWELPLLIVLPFVCIAIGLLILSHFVASSRHLRLLRSLIPKSGADSSTYFLRNSECMLTPEDEEPQQVSPLGIRGASITETPPRVSRSGVKSQRRLLVTNTPADRILTLLGMLMEGRTPPIEDVIAVRQAIRDKSDLYAAPIGLEACMTKKGLSSDVTLALLGFLDQAPQTVSSLFSPSLLSQDMPYFIPTYMYCPSSRW